MRVSARFLFLAAGAIVFSASLLSGDATQQATSSANAPKPTGIIEGVVVDAESGRPMPGQMVWVMGVGSTATRSWTPANTGIVFSDTDDPPIGGNVMSDGGGRFQISGLEAGWYEIRTYGWGAGEYGQTTRSDPPRMIALSSNQRRSGLRLHAFRQPTISGRITDESGRPVPFAPVRATPVAAFESGNYARTSQSITSTTDDRGRYLMQAPSGPFVLAVKPPLLSQTTAIIAAPTGKQPMMYPLTYYPSGRSRDSAVVLTAGADDLQGLDIRLEKIPSYSVTLSFPPVRTEGFGSIALIEPASGETIGTIVDARLGDGRMVFDAVPPGTYDIRGLIPPPMPIINHGDARLRSLPSEPTLHATEPVSVADRNVSVALTFQSGVRLSGSVMFEGGTPPAVEDLPAIHVKALDDPSVDLRGLYLSHTAFTTIQIPPGRYLLRPVAPYSPPQGWHLKSITAGGRDVLDGAIDVGSTDITDLTITFTTRPARIRGTVALDGAADAARPWITVFPVERAIWKAAHYLRPDDPLIRVLRMPTGSSGAYDAVMPPGTYFVVATAGPPIGDLAALAAIAETVVIADGVITTQNFSATKRLR